MGHLEEAAAALRSGAEAVPVNYAAGIDQEMGKVASLAGAAGGQLGANLAQESQAIQKQAQEFSQVLLGFKDKLNQTAAAILSRTS